MPNSILHKRSSTAGVVPHAALLANGELALNTADGTWFLKKTDGTVLDLRQPLLADGGAQPLAGINSDAQDWQTRVISAGGTVSAATFTAVNNFCNAITAAGIRDRFYRLNLFCGDNLAAALVPLYRGPTLSGTQFGNTTDTNVSNNFVAGDYVEIGITGGLKGNGSNKALRTGLLPSDMGGALHLSVALMSDVSVNTSAIGADNFMDADWTSASIDFATINSALRPRSAVSSNVGVNFAETVSATTAARLVSTSSRASGAAQRAYFNGALSATNSPTYQTHPAFDFAVFAVNRKNTGNVSPTAARLSAYSIGVNLTDAQVVAIDVAVRAFQSEMGRVAPVVTNADAQDWLTRVYAAGGTVSPATATAVNNFCATIDNAGLRDRFYRLNLFCGNNLTACLVPLYRGQTRTGTQYGNATDTNINFLVTDYAETGVNGGLLGNGSSKYLQTGITTAALPTLATGHLAAYTINATGQLVASFNAGFDGFHFYGLGSSSVFTSRFSWGSIVSLSPIVTNDLRRGFISMTRTDSTTSKAYKNGVQVGETFSTASITLPNSGGGFAVFAGMAETGSVLSHVSGRLGAYSIGSGMTDAQMVTYNNAMQAFQTALNRPLAVSNVDAQDWVARVYEAGGTVSQSTADAVNTFCNSINSAGLRDRFYRLNLFCGNDLTACRVPLYRGQSLSGTQFGNATDTNFNFVASDYVERGPTGGLTGNGNLGVQAGTGTKHLRTGLQQAAIGTSLMHLSTFVFGLNTTATQQQGFVGIRDNFSPANRWWVEYRGSVNTELGGPGVGFGMNALATGNFLITASRESNTLLRSYFNGLRYGTDAVTDISSTVKTSTRDFFVAAINIDADAAEFCNFRLGMYSIGLSMTETQASVFNSIVAAFNNALTRS